MPPIKPSEVTKKKEELLPEFVLEAANNLIAKNWNGDRSKFSLDDLIGEIIRVSGKEITREQVFDNEWLEIEDVYRAVGWSVEYDKPAYNEMYKPTFTFSKS